MSKRRTRDSVTAVTECAEASAARRKQAYALSDASGSGDGLDESKASSSPAVIAAREAMARVRRSREDWWVIGEGLLEGQTLCMRAAGTNQPMGRRYSEAMNQWLTINEFTELCADAAKRSRLLACVKHRAEIEAWLLTLTEKERFQLCEPDRLWKRFSKTTKAPKETKPSHIARLKETIRGLEEDIFRLKTENGVWNPDDSPKAIANKLLARLDKTTVSQVVQAGEHTDENGSRGMGRQAHQECATT